mgnify:CR=1 FL=1
MIAQNILDLGEISDKGIVMPDGYRLPARIWRPENAHSFLVPAIPEFSPYRKRDGTAARML